jgi:L-lactate dehydrogenase complex protein LldF
MPLAQRTAFKAWALLAKRPTLYHAATSIGVGFLSLLGRRKGAIRSLPLLSGWTRNRDLPAPQGRTFQDQWRAGRRT